MSLIKVNPWQYFDSNDDSNAVQAIAFIADLELCLQVAEPRQSALNLYAGCPFHLNACQRKPFTKGQTISFA